jgi:hypothetical protein
VRSSTPSQGRSIFWTVHSSQLTCIFCDFHLKLWTTSVTIFETVEDRTEEKNAA